MSGKSIEELINALENIKSEDYELFVILKNHLEHLSSSSSLKHK